MSSPPTPSPPPVPKNPATAPVCPSPRCLNKAGQELCYLCHQRAARNIPVSFEEERRRKELEQDALLQQYQQMKDQEAILLEQVRVVIRICSIFDVITIVIIVRFLKDLPLAGLLLNCF